MVTSINGLFCISGRSSLKICLIISSFAFSYPAFAVSDSPDMPDLPPLPQSSPSEITRPTIDSTAAMAAESGVQEGGAPMPDSVELPKNPSIPDMPSLPSGDVSSNSGEVPLSLPQSTATSAPKIGPISKEPLPLPAFPNESAPPPVSEDSLPAVMGETTKEVLPPLPAPTDGFKSKLFNREPHEEAKQQVNNNGSEDAKTKDKQSKKEAKKKVDKPTVVYVPPTQYRLPSTIYKKSYSSENRHLPVARYENEYDSLLFGSIEHDDVNGVRALLNTGRPVNMRNISGDTLLMHAIKFRAIKAVRLLLGRGADVNAINYESISVLALARQSGNTGLVNTLISMGAIDSSPVSDINAYGSSATIKPQL